MKMDNEKTSNFQINLKATLNKMMAKNFLCSLRCPNANDFLFTNFYFD